MTGGVSLGSPFSLLTHSHRPKHLNEQGSLCLLRKKQKPISTCAAFLHASFIPCHEFSSLGYVIHSSRQSCGVPESAPGSRTKGSSQHPGPNCAPCPKSQVRTKEAVLGILVLEVNLGTCVFFGPTDPPVPTDVKLLAPPNLRYLFSGILSQARFPEANLSLFGQGLTSLPHKKWVLRALGPIWRG